MICSDDGEFLFLYDYYEPVNPSYPYWDCDPFCLDSFDSCECEAHFRLAKRRSCNSAEWFSDSSNIQMPTGNSL